jgi:hypothetical protein
MDASSAAWSAPVRVRTPDIHKVGYLMTTGGDMAGRGWMRCTCAIPVQLEAEPFRDCVNGEAELVTAHLTVRCRTCAGCLEHTRMSWTARTKAELLYAIGRGWFLTLTLADALGRQPTITQFYRELRNFFRMLRHDGHHFRYVAIAERGTDPAFSMRLHLHVILVETTKKHITKRELEARWPGNSKPKLVTDPKRQAAYVFKYMSKTLGAERFEAKRVIASPHWGNPERSEPLKPTTTLQEASRWVGNLADFWKPRAVLIGTEGGEGPPQLHTPDATGTVPTCAVHIKAPTATRPEKSTDPPEMDFAECIKQLGMPGCTVRILPFDEIPPEIVQSWGLVDPAFGNIRHVNSRNHGSLHEGVRDPHLSTNHAGGSDPPMRRDPRSQNTGVPD